MAKELAAAIRVLSLREGLDCDGEVPLRASTGRN